MAVCAATLGCLLGNRLNVINATVELVSVGTSFKVERFIGA
jgi:hypothetical protein